MGSTHIYTYLVFVHQSSSMVVQRVIDSLRRNGADTSLMLHIVGKWESADTKLETNITVHRI